MDSSRRSYSRQDTTRRSSQDASTRSRPLDLSRPSGYDRAHSTHDVGQSSTGYQERQTHDAVDDTWERFRRDYDQDDQAFRNVAGQGGSSSGYDRGFNTYDANRISQIRDSGPLGEIFGSSAGNAERQTNDTAGQGGSSSGYDRGFNTYDANRISQIRDSGPLGEIFGSSSQSWGDDLSLGQPTMPTQETSRRTGTAPSDLPSSSRPSLGQTSEQRIITFGQQQRGPDQAGPSNYNQDTSAMNQIRQSHSVHMRMRSRYSNDDVAQSFLDNLPRGYRQAYETYVSTGEGSQEGKEIYDLWSEVYTGVSRTRQEQITRQVDDLFRQRGLG